MNIQLWPNILNNKNNFKSNIFLLAEEVLRLIETLVKKEPSIMALSHVPLFLCSYNASLSVVDQILLRVNYYI